MAAKKTTTEAQSKAPQPVKLRWLGNNGVRIGVRIFGAYRWEQSNNYTQLVTEPEAVEDLLTNGDFELVGDAN